MRPTGTGARHIVIGAVRSSRSENRYQTANRSFPARADGLRRDIAMQAFVLQIIQDMAHFGWQHEPVTKTGQCRRRAFVVTIA